MSLLLFWENPLTTFNPRSSRVVISRIIGDGPRVTFETDATWGFFEDTENDDESAVYEVEYRKARDLSVEPTVVDADITRYKRQSDQAIFTYEKRLFTGGPDAGRGLEISDYGSTAGAHSFRLLTNLQGIARFPLKFGTRVRIHVDDEFNALDTIVPSQKDVSWSDLIANGSWVAASRRGLF